MKYLLNKTFDHAIYQGKNKNKNYFEGWYFKNVSGIENHIYAFIPGVAMQENGDKHAFIQMIDGLTASTHYFSFPYESFSFNPQRFQVSIDKSTFSDQGIKLDIDQSGEKIKGELYYTDQHLFKGNVVSPGIMGWYSYVPFMQCYHGLVSMHHQIEGSIHINGGNYSFDNGSGYIEKDWGRSFPKAWLWTQSNNFSTPKTSFMLSVADVPWLGSSFTGFLGIFLHRGELIRFATYNGSKITECVYNDPHIRVTIRGKDFTLHYEGEQKSTGILKAPDKGSMKREIAESISSEILVEVKDKRGNPVFKETGTHAGIEMVGDIKGLFNF